MTENKSLKFDYPSHLALLAVQFFFGASAVLGKTALQVFPALTIVGFRAAGGALAFYLIQRLRGGSMRLEKRAHYFSFALFSLFGVIFNHLLFFKGLSLTTAANTSLLSVLIPVFTIVISALLGKDKLNWRKSFGVLIASAGALYLIDPRRASFASDNTVGNLLIVLNSLSYAIYIAISKELVSYYGALKSIAWVFLFGALVNFPIGLYSMASVDWSFVNFTGLAATVGVVLFPTILAYYWNAWALARVEPGIVAIYVYLQPLIGFILAVLFLGEKLSVRLLVSAILVFGGVSLVIKRQRLQFTETHLTAD